jgi:hypothetical protein
MRLGAAVRDDLNPHESDFSESQDGNGYESPMGPPSTDESDLSSAENGSSSPASGGDYSVHRNDQDGLWTIKTNGRISSGQWAQIEKQNRRRKVALRDRLSLVSWTWYSMVWLIRLRYIR